MIPTLLALTAGTIYFLIGIILFITNLLLFEWWTPFDAKNVILRNQNKALGHIIRGQLLAQGILIATVIYFTGHTPQDIVLPTRDIIGSFLTTLGFGIIGMLFLQGTLKFMTIIFPIEKEILIDRNESLGMIIEAFLIAISLIISIALYSY